jgi:hypothetical protein
MYFNANDQNIICDILLLLLTMNIIGIIKHKNIAVGRLQLNNQFALLFV